MRNYLPVADKLGDAGDRSALMRRVVDALWDAFGSRDLQAAAGFSWVGFYLAPLPGAEAMVLGACRDTPACSPIGLHGVCGRGFLQRQAIIVADVRELSGNYIACDPRDVSELVVPLFAAAGDCWGVLDVDSFQPRCFAEHDARALLSLAQAAGLSSAPADAVPVVRL